MIYGSQQDCDALSGEPGTGQAGCSPAEFAAMGAFMEWFGKDLAESGELVDSRGLTAGARPRDPPAGRRACGDRRALPGARGSAGGGTGSSSAEVSARRPRSRPG
jgi:hypothetical protein